MFRGKPTTTIALILLVLTSLSFSQSPKEVQEVLKKVSETYRSLKSYHFEAMMVIEMKGEDFQNKIEAPIVMAAIKPDKSRIEIKSSMLGAATISDGQTTWIYDPLRKQYTKKVVVPVEVLMEETHSKNRGDLVSKYRRIAEGVKKAKILREETVEADGKSINCYVLEVEYEPRASYIDIEPSPMTFWIDKVRYIVLREISLGKTKSSPIGRPMEMKQTTTITMAKVNELVPDTLFMFTPPAGAKEVEELSTMPDGRAKVKWVGKEAADFTLKDLEGKEFRLKSLRGKVVMLDFWASWCGPCRVGMPLVEKLYREFKDKGLVVLGINHEAAQSASEFLKKNNYTFPTLVDSQREVTTHYQVEAIPTIITIDTNGKITDHYVGSRTETDLRDALKNAGVK